MKLYLVQHGEAKTKQQDSDRSLTDRGIADTEKVVRWMSKISEQVNQIRHSGKKRAEQTAQIFANLLKPPRGSVPVSDLNPNDDVRIVACQLNEQDESLMIVGHLPQLIRLAGLLLTGDPENQVVKFKNSGVVCLISQDKQWILSWAVIPDNIIL